MTQPRLPLDLQELLRYHGFSAHCYQPVSMFKQGKRTLPNVPNEDDPWEVFLRRPNEIGLVVVACGWTLREAVEEAIRLRPGLSAAMVRLGDALDGLTETVQCR